MPRKPKAPVLVDPYIRNATLIEVSDGDTIKVLVDLGLDTFRKIKLRFIKVNTAERNTAEGPKWTAFVKKWFEGVGIFQVQTTKDRTDPYARYLADVRDGTRSLVDDLIAAGAPLYTTKKQAAAKPKPTEVKRESVKKKNKRAGL